MRHFITEIGDAAPSDRRLAKMCGENRIVAVYNARLSPSPLNRE
jgi:hypothetical protein